MDTVEIEHHQIELKYAHLRRDEAKAKARLIASLSEVGQQNPVLVVVSGSNRYTLIDGYKRLSALKTLAKDTVTALVLEVNETAALLLWHSQEQSTARSALEDGWFLLELIEHHRQSRDDLVTRLQRSHSWVSRRISLVTDLPEEAQELVRQGKICPYAAGKYLVPLARANKFHCTKLLENLGKRKTSSRELETLYQAWRKGSRRTKEQIVTHPNLYLKVDEKVVNKLAGTGKDNPLLTALKTIAAVCCRAQVNFHNKYASVSEIEDELSKAWRKAEAAFRALGELLNERRINVES